MGLDFFKNLTKKLGNVVFKTYSFYLLSLTFFTFSFSSDSDVAFIIKYQFIDEQPDATSRKRKLVDVKRSSVLDYSSLKLPAAMFATYLENDSIGFINDCLR